MIKKIKLACAFLICLICLFILIDEVKAQIVVPTPMLVDSDENEAINSQKPIISGLKNYTYIHKYSKTKKRRLDNLLF